MGFFKEYMAKRRVAAEKARRLILPTRQIVWTAMLAAFLFATFMALFFTVTGILDNQWHPAEATTRVEMLYFNSDIDRTTGKRVPDKRSGRELVVIDFRKADGTPCTSFLWSEQTNKEILARAPEQVTILYHEGWQGSEVASDSALVSQVQSSWVFPKWAWVASSGSVINEYAPFDLRPKLDPTWFRIGSLAVPNPILIMWSFHFVLMTVIWMALMFWSRRKAIALVAAESKAASAPRETTSPA